MLKLLSLSKFQNVNLSASSLKRPRFNCQNPKLIAMSRLRKVTHVIFDLDGLLLNTEVIYEQIMNQIAGRYGKVLPFETRMQILGTTEQRSAELMVNSLELPITIDEYLEQYHKLCAELLPNADMMRGSQRLLLHLHKNKVPFALATSSSENGVQVKIARHKEYFELFSHRVCGSSDPEVKQGKPAPDIFLVAAARFPDHPDPQDCLVFEDAPNGVTGARKAGMQVVMVPAPATPEEMRKDATLVLSSLECFKPEEFCLPPFPNNC